jgi:DNA-binding XRE family transcriptional regulator
MEQKQLAEIIGVDKCTIANWEKNRNAPRIRHLPKIIDFLGYQPWDEGYRNLSERIIKERQKLGLSRKKLAHKVGLSPDTIADWEKGKHKPNRELLRTLTAYFVHGEPLANI